MMIRGEAKTFRILYIFWMCVILLAGIPGAVPAAASDQPPRHEEDLFSIHLRPAAADIICFLRNSRSERLMVRYCYKSPCRRIDMS